jgi:hypothetical protein
MAIALALYAAMIFTYLGVLWNPMRYGEFGLTYDNYPQIVMWVAPGSPADRAGIRRGDVLNRPAALHDRIALAGESDGAPQRAGETITIPISRDSNLRTVTLRARPLQPLSAVDRSLLVLKFLWAFTFVAVGLVLVLLRPSVMTWGFYLFALNPVIVFWPSPAILAYMPASLAAAVLVAQWVVAPAGLAGFIIFCVRFPNNAPAAWGRTLEGVAVGVFAVAASFIVYGQIAAIQFLHVPTLVIPLAVVTTWALVIAGTVVLLNAILGARGVDQRKIGWIALATICVLAVAACFDAWHEMKINGFGAHPLIGLFMMGTAAFAMTLASARGLERYRIKWVVLGLICALIASAVDLTWTGTAASPRTIPKWALGAEILYIALPLTVAYAGLRHRIIDIRFVASRSIIFGIIAVALGFTVAVLDWLFTTRVPSSRFEAAAYIGVALLVGLSLNTIRRSLSKAVDSLLFRQWHRTGEHVRTIADCVSRARSEHDLYKPLTADIAAAFSLASVALFERVEGGGFVRVAAHGWPPSTIWHILPDDSFARRAIEGRHVVAISEVQRHERDLPSGVARPEITFPLAAGKRVAAMVLCSAHENGTAVDPDEIQVIRSLCADAAVVYGQSPTSESERDVMLDGRVEPMRA